MDRPACQLWVPAFFGIIPLIMAVDFDRRRALVKIAFGLQAPGWGPSAGVNPPTWSPTVGISNPPPTVSDVLNGIGVAQARGIGSQADRTDAFGRIIDSGLVNTSPAGNALRMIGGGVLGRALTSAFTGNSFLKGLGTGIGAVSAIHKW